MLVNVVAIHEDVTVAGTVGSLITDSIEIVGIAESITLEEALIVAITIHPAQEIISKEITRVLLVLYQAQITAGMAIYILG